VGHRAGLDAVICRESNPDRPARNYTDWAIPTPGANIRLTHFQTLSKVDKNLGPSKV
jgi:hypothetical protein